MENSNNSFVYVLKRGSQSHVTPEITKHALVLDDTCIKEFNFGMSLMGRAKDVLFEFDSLTTKEKRFSIDLVLVLGSPSLFKRPAHLKMLKGSFGFPLKVFLSKLGLLTLFVRLHLYGEYVEWEDDDLKSLGSCKHLCLKTNMKVIINERQKVIIQGKVYWIRVKELDAWFPNFQEDDQDDLSSDGESQEGDVANKADNNESDVDRVSESSFMHENDTAHKYANSCKKGEVGSHSEDPFNIYGILDEQKNNPWRGFIPFVKLPEVINIVEPNALIRLIKIARSQIAIKAWRKKLTKDQVQDLERPVTYEEVKRAVLGCASNPNNKSPGPDVDFEKAFDSVKWDYLDETLKAFGFGLKWRNWISSCLNNAIGSVLVNGSPTLEFQFHKGLKQDRWCWSLEGSQEFSVKSSRILIDNTILPKAEVPTRWLRIVPIKKSIALWEFQPRRAL
ncbi:RNA-directed DNA polymerase, eukaryota, nucleotide-binding alpha-beta plait domain protein [Tanacetum coccineum]